MSDEKGVGGLPDAGTIKPGAPGHIEDHDEMSRLMQVAADTLGITLDPPPPPPAVIGQDGHVDAHNTLLANIEQLAEAGGGGLPGSSSWGDFTTSGDEQASGTYTDTAGRDWKWAEWNVAADYSVNLTGGSYWLLAVGGGSRSYSDTEYLAEGQPGLVTEGLWELQPGTHTVTVGKKGLQRAVGQPQNYGQPSSVGDYGTQGFSPWGATAMGRGATTFNDSTGYASTITGVSQQYATGKNGEDVPGRSGDHQNALNNDGCVIIATVTNKPSDWNPPGALPGIGGWAEVTGVTGVGTKYSYTADGMDWSAFEWTADGELTTSSGLVDALMVSAASVSSARTDSGGHGGGVFRGIEYLAGAGPHEIIIGQSGQYALSGGPTLLNNMGPTGGLWGDNGWAGATQPPYQSTGLGGFSSYPGPGVMDDILGPSDVRGYGGGGNADTVYGGGLPPRANSGAGSTPGSDTLGAAGVVIVRVPATSDKTGMADGPFDTRTLREKAKQAAKDKAKEKIRDKHKSPVTQEIEES